MQAAVRSAGPLLAMAASLLSVVCVSDGLLLAAGDYAFCAGMHIVNLGLVAGAFASLPPTGLPSIWAVMVRSLVGPRAAVKPLLSRSTPGKFNSPPIFTRAISMTRPFSPY